MRVGHTGNRITGTTQYTIVFLGIGGSEPGWRLNSFPFLYSCSQMQQHDPRDYQILFLSLFLVLGIGTRDWTLQPQFIGVAIATCLLTQYISLRLWSIPRGNKAEGRGQRAEGNNNGLDRQDRTGELIQSSSLKTSLISLKSAMITALGLSLLLRVDQYSTMILAGVLAILSKFLFRFQGKHFFNPANFGIIS
ncbi:MAG: hypothetical protein RLP02_31685, partial [Coleofasciculus sp. C2-GNP5-27]